MTAAGDSRAGMWVAELWRYPVKSMGGEPLQVAEVRPDGIVGDRIAHVQAPSGRLLTARTRPRLLGHHASLGSDGEPLMDGRPWDSAEVARDVEEAAGAGARLVRFEGSERFDVLPLLVATDGAVQALGHDGRRLRANLLIGGVEGLAEREWEGRVLRAGEVLIGMHTLRQRCIMTTFDPDTLEQDTGVLKRINREFGGLMALNCHVIRGGTVRVGDAVEVCDPGDVA
ncbi:MAG: domain containing protein [Gemmatimonadetes bacterium]|nr:domain containing protein [Gemmatimonadota bacterium]